MSAPKIVVIDTETTSLRPDRRAWEVALIVREPGKDDAERSWFIHVDDLDLGNADVMSLKIGRFYERHPQFNGTDDGWAHVAEEPEVLADVEALTRGAVLVGAVPSFDADVLGQRMRANGICPSWHYHLQDVETLVLGWLHGQRFAGEPVTIPDWPLKSDVLSMCAGVNPEDFDRHTALGDCKWALAQFDAVTKAAPLTGQVRADG